MLNVLNKYREYRQKRRNKQMQRKEEREESKKAHRKYRRNTRIAMYTLFFKLLTGYILFIVMKTKIYDFENIFDTITTFFWVPILGGFVYSWMVLCIIFRTKTLKGLMTNFFISILGSVVIMLAIGCGYGEYIMKNPYRYNIAIF